MMTVKRVRIAEPGQYITTGLGSFVELRQERNERVVDKPPVSCLKLRKTDDLNRKEASPNGWDHKGPFGM